MKEALKLFGAMLAIVVSVSALHDVQPAATAATAATVATADSSIIVCRPRVCTTDEECRGCGPCVDAQCIAEPPPIQAF